MNLREPYGARIEIYGTCLTIAAACIYFMDVIRHAPIMPNNFENNRQLRESGIIPRIIGQFRAI